MKLKFVGNGPFGSTTRKNSSAYYLREAELLIKLNFLIKKRLNLILFFLKAERW